MPLRCLNEHRQNVYAFAHDDAAWARLAADNRRLRHLRTACCDAAVAAKTSRLGTRFFAHIAGGGCATADETPEHLHLKAMAVAAARARGWTAETEIAGTTPDGEPWRADVLATRGRKRVAVEIQWSPQADAETARRQARYAASGVRCLWLFRQAAFSSDADTPAVRVRGSLSTGFTALGLPIADVLDAAFDRRLRFGLPTGAQAHVAVAQVVVPCWGERCGAINRAVLEVVVTRGENRCAIALRRFGDHPEVLAAVLGRLRPDRARGRIKPRASRTLGETYLSNGCFRCDRLFGDLFLPDHGDSRSIVAAFDVTIDDDWRRLIDSILEFEPVWSVVPSVAPPSASR